MMVPAAWINREQIDAVIAAAHKGLSPDVVRIRYSLEEDWTGDPSIFFRVVLSDEASTPGRLREVSSKVRRELEEAVNRYDHGLQAYFSFRGVSEQKDSREQDWN